MRTIVAVGVACLLAGVAAAQGVAPLGDQVQVNSYVTGSQTNPALATDAGGAAVVVWTGTSSGGNDSSQTSIQSRRLDASGALLGADFQVNTTTPGYQLRPAVATQPGGEFVVVWGSASPSGNDSSYSVEARRFDAAGLPLASQFHLNSYTTSVQELPAVDAAADGGFLMVWHSTGSFGADSAGRSIQARRYSAAGAPFGAELEVNAYTPGDQMDPAVAALPSGDFAVVWNNISGSPGDSSERSIQGRLVDADGVPLGGEFQVNSFTPGTQYNPAVAGRAARGVGGGWWGGPARRRHRLRHPRPALRRQRRAARRRAAGQHLPHLCTEHAGGGRRRRRQLLGRLAQRRLRERRRRRRPLRHRRARLRRQRHAARRRAGGQHLHQRPAGVPGGGRRPGRALPGGLAEQRLVG